MKICHFLKCSSLIILTLIVISSFASSNTIEKSTKSAEKSSLKSAIQTSTVKSNLQNLKSESSLNNKKLTSLKPKEEKVQKTLESAKQKDNGQKDHPERVNTNVAAAESNSKGKTVATETAANNFNAENKNKEKKTSALDFFSKTSKSNQSTAGKAFAGFIGGFILFYLSIVLICRTERDSVVETKYIDWINEDVKFVDLNGSSGDKDLVEKKPILIEGIILFWF